MRGLVCGLVRALCGLSMDWVGHWKNNAVLGWGANKSKIPIRTPSKTTNIRQSQPRPCTHKGLVQNISQVLCEVLCEGLVRTRLWLFFEALCAQDPKPCVHKTFVRVFPCASLVRTRPQFSKPARKSCAALCESCARFFISVFFSTI